MSTLLVKGPVLGPGWIGRPELGLTDRGLTEQEIQKAAHGFTAGTPIIDVQHDLIKQADVVESFITSDNYTFNDYVYPPGTWFVTSQVSDPKIISQIQSGELIGYSVGAWPEEYRDKLVAKGLFTDVSEGEWFALAVSLAKLPFYPEAVFKVFEPDEIIKKEIPELEDDKLSEDGNVLANAFNKLLDIAISKNVEAEDVPQIIEQPKFITEEMLDAKLDAHYQKIEGLLQVEESTEESDEEAEEEAPESEEAASEESEETEETPEESEPETPEVADDTMISKAIQIDEVKNDKEASKGFLGDCGCDALGRNPKYL